MLNDFSLRLDILYIYVQFIGASYFIVNYLVKPFCGTLSMNALLPHIRYDKFFAGEYLIPANRPKRKCERVTQNISKRDTNVMNVCD